MVRQHGYILLPVVLLITLVAAVAFLINNESVLDSGVTGSKTEAKQVEYLAQAGFQHALWGINNSGCSGNLTLPTTPIGNGSYTATVTSPVTSSNYTLNATQDTWLKESVPTENHGSDIELSVKAAAGDNMRALYQFDLSAIPAGSQVASATAWFYVTGNDDEGAVDIHEVTALWTEGTADWVTMNDKYAAPLIASIPVQAASGVWVQVNITSLVQSWVNGNTNNGIMLLANSDAVESTYSSKEAGSSQRPRIEVLATSGTASPVTITATGTFTGSPTPANDITRSLTRAAVPAYQPTSSLVLQPAAASGEDAEIWDQQPNNNYGNAAETWVSSASNDTTRTLLRFNMGKIPAGARILQATLSLDRQSGSGADQPVSAHRIKNPWSEDSVTWNSRQTGMNWDTAGGDYDNIALATTPVGPVNQRYEWSITALVQGWVDGSYPNYGVALTAAIAGMAGQRFYTSDHAVSSRWPSLSITYTCECGIVCMAPQGSGKIAMVGNWAGFNPDPLDLAREDILESWGYQVDIYDDNVLWLLNSSFYDAIYISATASDGELVDQLKYEPIGIVYELEPQNNDLGMASGDTSTVGTDINLIDTSHEITQPFPAGPLTIKSAASRLASISGTAAAGAQILAETGGLGSLLALESGGALGGTGVGEFAAGRRVMLPVGMSSTDDWTHLNHNGLLIVQRAIQWGTGIMGPVVTAPIILSTDSAATLGGLSFDDIDMVNYDLGSDVASLFFEGALTTLNFDIDAIHVLANGHILLSTKDAATLGGLSFLDGDLVDYDPVTDMATLYFDEAAFGTNEDIVSVYVMDNGHLLLSTDSDATLGGLSFTDNDLVEYDLSTDTATLYFDGSTTTLVSDIDAVHVLSSGHLVLSTKDDASLGGLSFKDADLVDYDPVTDTAVLYFDESRFSNNEDVISAHIGPGSGAASGSAGGATTAPIAHWKLDETSGLTAVDSVGGHDGTLNNGPVWAAGQLDGALDFDGSNDAIRVTHDDTLSLTETMTFTAWINASSFGSSYQTIIAKDGGSGSSNYWFGSWQQELDFGFFAGGFYREVFTSGLNLQPGTWYHLAASFDNTTNAVILYLDGVPVQNGELTFSPTAVTADLAIGRSPIGEYWRGLLDDVRIYDSVLPASEIADLYTAGGGGGGGPPPAGVVFEEFTQARLGSNGDQMDISKPAGTVAGDLLIAAVVTDGEQGGGGISPPTGWNLVNHGIEDEQVTLGVWWKIAGTSESSQYRFTWPEDQETYGWIMRFTGHDVANPINAAANIGGKSNSPSSLAVTTTVADTMILRIGGFDDDDISVGVPGLSGHTVITMQKSSNGNGTTSGGAGFKTQEAAGNSGTSSFSLSRSEEYRAVTIGIAPAP